MDKTYFGSLYVNGILPVAAIEDENKALFVAEALLKGGIDCIAVLFNRGAALTSVKLIHANFPDMLIGAGGVLTASSAEAAFSAGASFAVCPGFSLPLINKLNEAKIPIIPGIATASEVMTATYNGINAVSFFPAKQAGGVDYLKKMTAIFPDMKFMPAGGVQIDTLDDYVSIDSVFCCAASFVCPKELIAESNYKKIAELSKSAVAVVKSKREKRYFYA
ncbi:MAG: bifunctional 4-hydroxy-2-oxoglutarate aldolase/2-dehydro-3-deoxy-phosphogluconate aldolase [Ruminococcus sp.]|jgi:Entner-Doudoroff aldolase|nr:bifunctional 4-hydroxy-2-oxoglutarate aldolase/2-dehydro-3-deoxy-phosphogluconate aldolase [Ruminococcus sp.]